MHAQLTGLHIFCNEEENKKSTGYFSCIVFVLLYCMVSCVMSHGLNLQPVFEMS